MKLYIKNMVCNRCIMVVQDELEKIGLQPINVELGSAELGKELNKDELKNLNTQLIALGFSLIDDKKSQLIERVKNIIVDLVHNHNADLKTNLSTLLEEKLNQDYNQISSVFSEIENTTIEKYFIHQKIERVKELIVYGELTLSEIAFQLHYSSVAHLSTQFKKITGLNPSHFKTIKSNKRKPLDEI